MRHTFAESARLQDCWETGANAKTRWFENRFYRASWSTHQVVLGLPRHAQGKMKQDVRQGQPCLTRIEDELREAADKINQRFQTGAKGLIWASGRELFRSFVTCSQSQKVQPSRVTPPVKYFSSQQNLDQSPRSIFHRGGWDRLDDGRFSPFCCRMRSDGSTRAGPPPLYCSMTSSMVRVVDA